MSHDVVLERVKYAVDQGATQIMIQGGVNPELGIDWFETLFARVGREYPEADIHSLSVSEIVGLAHVEGMSTRDVLARLKDAGMKSLPGAGAEILVERVRKRISARKVKPDEWLGRDARRATAGHADDRDDDVRLDRNARRSGSNTCTCCASCKTKSAASPRSSRGTTCRSRRRCAASEATGLEYLRVLAISRLYLDNFAHLQASWLTPGLKMGQLALILRLRRHGRHDHRRAVVHDAGSTNEATRRDLENLIVGAGFKPVIRDTYWNLRPGMALATA